MDAYKQHQLIFMVHVFHRVFVAFGGSPRVARIPCGTPHDLHFVVMTDKKNPGKPEASQLIKLIPWSTGKFQWFQRGFDLTGSDPKKSRNVWPEHFPEGSPGGYQDERNPIGAIHHLSQFCLLDGEKMLRFLNRNWTLFGCFGAEKIETLKPNIGFRYWYWLRPM